MGNSISAIYDDYEDYTYLCEEMKITPLGIRDNKSFYNHAKEIIKSMTEKQHKKYKEYYWYQKLS